MFLLIIFVYLLLDFVGTIFILALVRPIIFYLIEMEKERGRIYKSSEFGRKIYE